jgi:glucose-fructose oxidoreductase
MITSNQSRRNFLKNTGTLTLASAFPAILIPKRKESIGVALVGLGYYSTDLLAPAFEYTQHCHLAGIVTGTPSKIPVWQEKYGIKDRNIYNYENIHQVANNDEIDVLYIVLPNSLHTEFSVKAAEAGKHVFCEKPMAVTEKECHTIIDACEKNKVKLTVGYRMQHEPNTQTVMKYAKTEPYGAIRELIIESGFFDRRTNHWRLEKSMGGGVMYDMGVYCLNAARYVTGEEPKSVTAFHTTTRPELYDEVDETTYFTLEFPGGAVARCKTSFGMGMNYLRVNCDQGWYELSPFQSYSGIRGITSDGTILKSEIPNQQARQMDNDSIAIMENREVLVPGEEGIKDVRLVEAVYRSASLNKPVEL